MGGGQRTEYNREPLSEYSRSNRALQEFRDADFADQWPDCFDQNYTLSNDKYWSPEMWAHDSSDGDDEESRARKEFFRQRSEPVISINEAQCAKAKKKSAQTSNSSPFALTPGSGAACQNSPFDFDDFLATIKTDDHQGDMSQPETNKSRFKQFFDSGAHHASPPKCKAKTRLLRPPVLTEEDVIPSPLSSIIGQDADDITEADMMAATSRFQIIREASIASLVHDSSEIPKIQADDRPPEVLPQPLAASERDRLRHKVSSLSPSPIHSPNRWPPNVHTPPPHAAPPNVATTALLQARLLTQQRSPGIFPAGQVGPVAQLVRPSAVPVYQAGVQAGLPLQSAALLSQFVWLNVL